MVSVAFDLELDNVDADNGRVVTIDINDATADEIIATRIIRRSEFNQPFQLQTFSVEADLRDRPGHIFEARVYWHDISYVSRCADCDSTHPMTHCWVCASATPSYSGKRVTP